MGIKLNFDVKKKGMLLYVSVLQKSEDKVVDIELREVSLTDYIDKYKLSSREANNYDFMLLGFKELIHYINDNCLYEEGDLTIEHNNKILLGWVSDGVKGETRKKYGLLYDTFINNLELMISKLGDNKVSIVLVSKNEAKKYLTDAQLKLRGKDVSKGEDKLVLTSKSDLSKNKPKRTMRVSGEGLNDKVIRLNKAN